jgi:hypothetical protein
MIVQLEGWASEQVTDVPPHIDIFASAQLHMAAAARVQVMQCMIQMN